jgi:hypothetical protein
MPRAADPEDRAVEDFYAFVARKIGSRSWVVDDGQGEASLRKHGYTAKQIIARAQFEAWRAEFNDATEGVKV